MAIYLPFDINSYEIASWGCLGSLETTDCVAQLSLQLAMVCVTLYLVSIRHFLDQMEQALSLSKLPVCIFVIVA